MGLYKTTPPMSARMGALWCLSGIRDAAVIEYGCMGHMAYGRTFLHRMGSYGAKLYSTHIGETDIAMGDTERLTRAVQKVSETEGIKTIFLLPSSVPEVVGIDLAAIANELSPRFPDTRLISLPVGGFDICGHKGVENTLLHLAEVLSKDTVPTEKPTFNIIGSCADLFAFQPDAAELSRLMECAFFARPLCTLTSGTQVADLEKMGGAHINLVIRRDGRAAAEYLMKRYGTPYLMARPYGVRGTLDWLERLEQLTGLKADKTFIQSEKEGVLSQIEPIQAVLSRFLRAHRDESKLVLAGHMDVISGIALYGRDTFGFEKTLCYSDCSCMADSGTAALTDQIKQALAMDQKGFLMGSGELLQLANRDQSLQIATPDNLWRHAYEPPLAGFRGAVNLAAIWANEMMRKDRGK